MATNVAPGDTTVWGLAALRRHFGNYYEFAHIGLTWYAWPHDGHLTRAITALDPGKLRTKIVNDLASPRIRIPHQRPAVLWGRGETAP